jgi:hypothetical protein
VGPEGGEFIDYIGRTETLAEDMLNISNLLGVQLHDLPSKINCSKPVEIDQCVLDRVKAEERIGIERWYGPETRSRREYASLETAMFPDLYRW